MNYEDEYNTLIETRLALQPQRTQERKEGSKFYESHHIVPKFMGGGDEKSNRILLSFREHFIAHLLYYKMCLKSNKNVYSSFYAVEKMMQVTKNRTSIMSPADLASGAELYESYKIEFWSQYTPEQHPRFGAHLSDEACASISKHRLGTMPIKNAITGEILGSVSTTHPKVLSGEWVHVTKGREISETEMANRSSKQGSANNNFKELTTERRKRLYLVVQRAVVDKIYVSKTIFINELKKEFTEFKKISEVWVTNNFGTLENLISETNLQLNLNLQYVGNHRTTKHIEKIRIKNQKNRWISKDGVAKIIQEEELDKYLAQGFKRGRLN